MSVLLSGTPKLMTVDGSHKGATQVVGADGLTVTSTNSNNSQHVQAALILPPGGKYGFFAKINTLAAMMIGYTNVLQANNWVGLNSTQLSYNPANLKTYSSSTVRTLGITPQADDYVVPLIDTSNGKFWAAVYRSGTFYYADSGDPAAGTGENETLTSPTQYFLCPAVTIFNANAGGVTCIFDEADAPAALPGDFKMLYNSTVSGGSVNGSGFVNAKYI